MKRIYFITGNENKFREVQAMLPGIKQLRLDLEEIQETDPHRIIQAKMQQAFKHKKAHFIIEDTSLYLDCLNGLPGPLIKWFLEKIGVQGIYNISQKLGNNKAQAKTIIGYAKSKKEIIFFEGIIEGEIIKPSGTTNFGWNPIFKPKGYKKTFQEMTQEEKNKISMRKLAVEKLKNYLKI